MYIREYSNKASNTIQEGARGNEHEVFSLGIIGEIGDLSSVKKKIIRDGNSEQLKLKKEEEIGDILWYINGLCSYYHLSLLDLVQNTLGDSIVETFDEYKDGVSIDEEKNYFNELIKSAIGVFDLESPSDKGALNNLSNILRCCASLCRKEGISFSAVAENNIEKVENRYSREESVPRFYDDCFPSDEQFQKNFKVIFTEIGSDRKNVKISINGVIVGARLTDNSREEDNYRFHDVFHLAYLAVLGWSPVMRSILNRKRKSQSKIDEVEDGARARATEEAISAFVFENLKDKDVVNVVDTKLLQMICELTQNYEVKGRTQKEWENAIKIGFCMFGRLKKKGEGAINVNMEERSLCFEELSESFDAFQP